MKLYFAGNQGYPKNTDLFIYLLLNNRLISYHYLWQPSPTKNEFETMKIYFAGGENKSWLKAIEEAKGDTSLYSYFYLNKDNSTPEKVKKFLEIAKNTQKNIFLDSGGFSAFTKGIDINIDEYISFIIEHKDLITSYAVLDVIGDYKATLKNQIYMESKGVSPIPCWHAGDPLEVLEEYCKKYKYIALGGLVPYARNKSKLIAILDGAFSIIKNHFPIKIHGFGMTGIPILKKYPFYSVDSTSWLGGSMRGEVYKFKNGTMITSKTNTIADADYSTIQFFDTNDKQWFARVVQNCIEWKKMEKYITELWAKRGIIWED